MKDKEEEEKDREYQKGFDRGFGDGMQGKAEANTEKEAQDYQTKPLKKKRTYRKREDDEPEGWGPEFFVEDDGYDDPLYFGEPDEYNDEYD